MGLDVPDLDDVTFEELREDALKRLPVLAPEWTDHNVHDPGVTILELLAWLVETYGYQLDQITDEHRLKYLDLVGVRPRPPQPASVPLVVDVPDKFAADAADDSVAERDDEAGRWILPAETPVVAERGDGEQIPFETVSDCILTPAQVVAVISESDRGRSDHTSDNLTDGRSFRGFGRDATPGDALYLGFDRNPFEHVDRLELCFHRTDDPVVDALTRDPAGTFEPTLQIRWEHCTDPDHWHSDDKWDDVEVSLDETNHLYTSGRIQLAVPDGWHDDEAARILGWETERYWLRGLIERRESDETEIPNDGGEMGDARSVGEPIRHEQPPRFDRIGTNLVPARHRWGDSNVSLERVVDGDPIPGDDGRVTTGAANQRFAFPDRPVETATVVVGEERWDAVDDFDASSPNDSHYVLDRDAGAVQFGDGRHGAIPPTEREVVAETVTYAGGAAGAVGADATWELSSPEYASLDVSAHEPPRGAREAESIDEALARARDRREEPARAVTADDYRTIALNTPDVRVERARAIAGHGGRSDTGRANHVTVVVVPETPDRRHRARPTDGFLRAVERHLCRHALVTDRVSVVAPRYVDVMIAAEITVLDGSDDTRVREDATTELTSFVDPLSGYDGDGWPFDRPIHESELYERLDALDGVDDVIDVSITESDGTDLSSDMTALPHPESVTVRVREGRRRCGRGF